MRISISKIRLFKSCRRAYELKYVEGLIPVQKAEALEIGSNYHSKLEELYNDGEFDSSDLSKESAMAMAYQKYIYPQFNVKSAEEWFEFMLGNNKVVGIVDGIADDGKLVEHKTTSDTSIEQYIYNLQWDEQILMYMLAKNVRQMYYTIIRKPTIRQKKSETAEEFFDRMVAWYDEDTDEKVRVVEIERTDEEVEQFRDELRDVCMSMCEAERMKLFYKNPTYCNHWGRMCEYANVCMHYDPTQNYIEFEKREVNNGN